MLFWVFGDAYFKIRDKLEKFPIKSDFQKHLKHTSNAQLWNISNMHLNGFFYLFFPLEMIKQNIQNQWGKPPLFTLEIACIQTLIRSFDQLIWYIKFLQEFCMYFYRQRSFDIYFINAFIPLNGEILIEEHWPNVFKGAVFL